MNLIIRGSFWGLVLWFPIVFVFLFLVDSGVVEVSQMDAIGNVAAILFVVFSGFLWVSCVIRLFQLWKMRSNKRNYIYVALLFFGTIIGSMIFYILESKVLKRSTN